MNCTILYCTALYCSMKCSTVQYIIEPQYSAISGEGVRSALINVFLLSQIMKIVLTSVLRIQACFDWLICQTEIVKEVSRDNRIT